MVLVPWCRDAGEDGVPEDGFGSGLASFLGWVYGFYVEEDLLCVPIEQRAQVCVR